MGRDVPLLRTRNWGTSAEAGVSRSKVGVVFSMNFASGDAESFVLYSLFIRRVYVLKEALKDRGTINAEEGVEKKKPSYTVGGNAI